MAAPAAVALLRVATALRHVRLCRFGEGAGGGGDCGGDAPPPPPPMPTPSAPAAAAAAAATGGASVVAALAALPGLASAAVEVCAPHADASPDVLARRCARSDARI